MSVVPYTGSITSDRDALVPYFSGSKIRDRNSSLFNSGSDRSLVDNNFFDRKGNRSLQNLLAKSSRLLSEDGFESRSMFGQMDRMMDNMMRDPFGDDPFFRGSSFPSLMAPTNIRETRDPFGLAPFGSLMASMFPSVPSIPYVAGVENMSREGSCQTYSSSSVMTMTMGPDGRPQAPLVMQTADARSCRWQEKRSRATQVYQATSSSRGGPDGIRETQRTMADSSTGVRKMAIGHHIDDRGHIIEKEMRRNGELEEKQEFINLDEEEVPEFDSEFRHRARQTFGAVEHRPRHRSELTSNISPARQRSTYLPALPATASYRRRPRPLLALTSGSRY